ADLLQSVGGEVHRGVPLHLRQETIEEEARPAPDLEHTRRLQVHDARYGVADPLGHRCGAEGLAAVAAVPARNVEARILRAPHHGFVVLRAATLRVRLVP